jgi:hypothetical protein
MQHFRPVFKRKVNYGITDVQDEVLRIMNVSISGIGDDRVWFAPYSLSEHLGSRQQVLHPHV